MLRTVRGWLNRPATPTTWLVLIGTLIAACALWTHVVIPAAQR